MFLNFPKQRTGTRTKIEISSHASVHMDRVLAETTELTSCCSLLVAFPVLAKRRWTYEQFHTTWPKCLINLLIIWTCSFILAPWGGELDHNCNSTRFFKSNSLSPAGGDVSNRARESTRESLSSWLGSEAIRFTNRRTALPSGWEESTSRIPMKYLRADWLSYNTTIM